MMAGDFLVRTPTLGESTALGESTTLGELPTLGESPTPGALDYIIYGFSRT